MTEFEQLISEQYSDAELTDTIRHAVEGATQDVIDRMPADAWR